MHRSDRIAERRKLVKRYSEEGKPFAVIKRLLAEHGHACSTPTLVSDRKALGLITPRPKRGIGSPVRERKEASAAAAVRNVRDRRRFKTTPVPWGQLSKIADEAAQKEGRTIFPSRVFGPEGPSIEPVLKDGCNNAKIGGDVLLGRLKGAIILTLTLQERATCPEACALWAGCYGNTMPHARRWAAGPALEESLRIEVAEACEANDLVLIRLHVLGDFYSFDYLKLWVELLDLHPNLHIFGFTAWRRGTEIGDGIHRVRKVYPERFMIRHSGATGPWGSFTIDFPTDRKEIGDALVCPEQRDAMNGGKEGRHCGNCAACWSCNRPIVFVEH